MTDRNLPTVLREYAANAALGAINAPRGVCEMAAAEIDRLTRELADARAEVDRLQTAKRRALKIADERSYENVGLRAENERLRDALKPFAKEAERFAVGGFIEMSGGAVDLPGIMVECQKCGAQVRFGSCCIKCDEPSDH